MWIGERVAARKSLLISYSAVMTVVVFIFTTIFSLYIPETKGFFNIGESGVYIAALTGGPIVGAIAGGIGSMLSDLALGYPIYAPATLVIKGVEGFVVGLASRRIRRTTGSSALSFVAGIIIAVLLYFIGTRFYVGSAEITLQIPYSTTLVINLPGMVWMLASALVILLTIFVSLRMRGLMGYALACMLGGIEMIIGYYLYEQLILGVAALAEVPFNVMQMAIGTIIALVVVGSLERIGL